MIPHSDCKVFNKHGKLIRIDSVADHCAKQTVGKDGTMFSCSKCGHTLNLNMACEKCKGKLNARTTASHYEPTYR